MRTEHTEQTKTSHSLTMSQMMLEHDDSDEVLAQKVDKFAVFVAFTRAGMSTSAGIPDFRGPEGKWTREARGQGSD